MAEEPLVSDDVANKRAIKSARTKKAILDATLELIAQYGLAYLSHRRIAQKADVRLSLTSYYFGTLDKLVEAAFDLFDEQALKNQQLVTKLIDDTYTRCQDCYSHEKVTQEYIAVLAKNYADHFEKNLKSRHVFLRVENHFIHELNFSEPIDKKVKAFNNRLQIIVEKICGYLGSSQPSLDAYIIIATVRRVEFDHVYFVESFDREIFDVLLKRLLNNAAAG